MSERPRIFIVDDSKVVLLAAREVLERAGYEVTTRQEAIGSTAEILRVQPDLVLLDVNMPLLEGDDLVRSIKRREPLRDTCVLSFSGKPDNELRQLAMLSGADGFIRKPSSATELVSEIEKWLSRRNRRAQAPGEQPRPEATATL
jgi:CheY-like chemotaxis protein